MPRQNQVQPTQRHHSSGRSAVYHLLWYGCHYSSCSGFRKQGLLQRLPSWLTPCTSVRVWAMPQNADDFTPALPLPGNANILQHPDVAMPSGLRCLLPWPARMRHALADHGAGPASRARQFLARVVGFCTRRRADAAEGNGEHVVTGRQLARLARRLPCAIRTRTSLCLVGLFGLMFDFRGVKFERQRLPAANCISGCAMREPRGIWTEYLLDVRARHTPTRGADGREKRKGARPKQTMRETGSGTDR